MAAKGIFQRLRRATCHATVTKLYVAIKDCEPQEVKSRRFRCSFQSQRLAELKTPVNSELSRPRRASEQKFRARLRQEAAGTKLPAGVSEDLEQTETWTQNLYSVKPSGPCSSTAGG